MLKVKLLPLKLSNPSLLCLYIDIRSIFSNSIYSSYMIKKIFFSLIVLVLIFTAGAYFFGSGILNKSIKKGVETFGPKITQTSVQLDEVGLSILSGNGTLSGLYVGNPEGYNRKNIFELNQIDVDINTKSILGDQIVINKIYIRRPHISYEKNLRSSNFKDLLKNIEGTSEKPESDKPEKDVVSKDEASKQLLIKKLIIEDATVFASILGVGTEISLPRIEMSDVGKKDGKSSIGNTLNQILIEILKYIAPAIQQNVNSADIEGKNILNSIVEPDEETIKKVNESINSLLNK